MVGTYINPGAAESLWLCCARLNSQPQSQCPGRGRVALGPSLAPTEGETQLRVPTGLYGRECVSVTTRRHDTEIIWVNQTFHRSGESKLWEEPQQKAMEAGRGEQKCAGVLTIFFFWSALKRTEVITKGKLFSSLG